MPTRSPLPEHWNVPQVFRNRLGAGAGRQRAMYADGHLLLVLHAPPTSSDSERTGRFFWRQPDGTWQSSDGSGTTIQALERHIEEFCEVAERLEESEEVASNAIEYFDILREVAPLRRTTRHLHESLQQARELVVEDRDLISCRDQAGSLERSTELLEAEVRNGLDFIMAKQTEEDAKNSRAMALSSHRLNVLAATFFPIATFAAIFGMNLISGLEEILKPWLFWAVLLAGVGMGLVLRQLVIETPPVRKPHRERY